MESDLPNNFQSMNDAADFWRYGVGANAIPAGTRNKNTSVRWAEYQHGPISEEQHNKWKASNAFDNGIAIILGRIWHNPQKSDLYINAIDVDNLIAVNEVCNYNRKQISVQHLADWTMVEQHKDAPDKMHVIIYSTRPFLTKSSSKSNPELVSGMESNEIPALEVKSVKTMLFVSPSLHRGGQRYEILGTMTPVICDDFENHIDSLLQRHGIPYLGANDGNGKSEIPIEELYKPDFEVYEGQNRHEALLRIMESLKVRNGNVMPIEDIKTIAQLWNQNHCKPPLDEIEFERQWKDAIKYVSIREQTNSYPKPSNTTSLSERKSIEKNRDDLYRKLKSRFTFKTLCDSQEILWYDNTCGVYRFNGDVKIKQELERIYEEELQEDAKIPKTNLLTESDRSEIVARVKWTTIIDRSEFEHYDNNSIINLGNGLFDIGTKELRPHTPDYVSTKQFPLIYDPQASWVDVLIFLKQIQNREGVITLIKMFGYILLSKSTKHQKAFFFAGRGDNGKSVLIDLIEAFVGENNCSSVKLHDLRNDRFMLGQMYGKIVNTYADIPATSLQDVGVFKALVTGDKLTAQHKYGKLFEFRNRAKQIFSGNSIPLSDGEDELAYFKRWVVLRFNSLFKGSKQDKDLIKKLATPENLSGLFNLALIGLELLERDGFPNIPIQIKREEYDRQSISHKRFVEDRCHINLEKQEFFITKNDYYGSYLKYCLENGYEALTADQVEVELSLLRIFEKRKKFDGIKKDCWIGIIPREEADRRNQEILERQRQSTLP
jgi:P4 family phage/plasmid primase-like protien